MVNIPTRVYVNDMLDRKAYIRCAHFDTLDDVVLRGDNDAPIAYGTPRPGRPDVVRTDVLVSGNPVRITTRFTDMGVRFRFSKSAEETYTKGRPDFCDIFIAINPESIPLINMFAAEINKQSDGVLDCMAQVLCRLTALKAYAGTNAAMRSIMEKLDGRCRVYYGTNRLGLDAAKILMDLIGTPADQDFTESAQTFESSLRVDERERVEWRMLLVSLAANITGITCDHGGGAQSKG